MNARLQELDLRFRSIIVERDDEQSLRQLLASVLIGGLLYGAVMGSFAGIFSRGIIQVAYSALKVPCLLLSTFSLSLPSFFVLNTLIGLRSDFHQVVQRIIGAQAVLAVVLASLAPYTVLWYAGSSDYAGAQLFSLVIFSIASIAGQITLRQGYRQLIARDPKHRYMLWTWLGIYSFVGVQMAWILRPFVGKPGAPTEFFRHDSLTNAYEAMARLIWRVVGGS